MPLENELLKIKQKFLKKRFIKYCITEKKKTIIYKICANLIQGEYS